MENITLTSLMEILLLISPLFLGIVLFCFLEWYERRYERKLTERLKKGNLD